MSKAAIYPFFCTRSQSERIAAVFLIISLACAGCSGLPKRNPVPEEYAAEAQIPGIPDARYWADEAPPISNLWNNFTYAELKQKWPEIVGVEHNYLAISGGGPRGAFTAGFLNGWTEAGTRPDFIYVTGVSTGALIAPFAFLGSDYDHVLKKVYTSMSTDDILTARNMYRIVTLDAVADSSPLRELIAQNFDEQVMQAVAAKYRRGYSLVIVTTDLDASRPVGWDLGAIASSGHPKALQLIQNILLASAAIPAAFPPVMFEVEANGELYDEMHVDGGVTSQLHLYPLALSVKGRIDSLDVQGKPTVYVIRNGHVEAPYAQVERSTIAIAATSMGTLMGNISYGDMYRIYLETQRDGLTFKLAYVPESFDEPMTEPFDPVYMAKLYDVGYELAVKGFDWKKTPPGFSLDSSDE